MTYAPSTLALLAKPPDARLRRMKEYRDLLDADIQGLQLIEWHRRQIDRLERERKARAPRLADLEAQA